MFFQSLRVQTRSLLHFIILTFLMILFLGSAAAFYPLLILVLTGGSLGILIGAISNKILDTILIALILVYLFVQFPITGLDTMRFVLLFIAVCYSFIVLRKGEVTFNPIISGVCILSIYAMAASYQSYIPSISLFKSISLFLLGLFLLFVPSAIQTLYPRLGMRVYFLRLYLLLAVGCVLSNAIYYILNPSSSNSYFSGTALYDGRFRGWGVNPNDLAASIAMLCIPVLWYSIQTQRSKPAKYGLAIVFIIALVELIATGSRSGILSGIIALLILVLGRRDWSSRVVIIFLITLVLGTIYFANPNNNILKKFMYRNETTLEGSGRLAAWTQTITRFKSRPVLGFGLGVSNPDGNISGLVFSLRSYAFQVANSYLSILQELGIIGFGIFILMLFIPTLKACWVEFSKFDYPIDRSRLVFVAAVCAGLLNVLFEGWLFSVGTLYCISFWLFASFIFEKDNNQPTQISPS